MSRRNFTLLIIVLIIIVIVLGFFYFNRAPSTPGGTNGGGTNFFSNFNPFGSKPSNQPPTTTSPTNISGGGETQIPAEKLQKVSSIPIAGYTVFQKERYKDLTTPPQTLPLSGEGANSPVPPAKGGSGGLKPTPPATEFVPALRYVERATGNIFQTFADKIDERKFSTTLIPAVYEAFFGSKGESVLMRYLKADDNTIETFFGNLPKELLGSDTTGDTHVKGSFLPEDITDMSISPDTTKAFYLFNMSGANTDTAIGTTLDLLGNKKVQVFSSPFTEWLSQWPNARMITLTTKPSAGALGYMYAIDPDKKDLREVLGGIAGLTTLTSPSGKLVLYADSNLSLYIYDTTAKTSNLLGIKTLPEKCVWGAGSDVIYCSIPKSTPAGEYPDDWYKGEVSFGDQIWKIDATTGTTTLLIDPATVNNGEEIDGIKLSLDQNENYLFFVNKKDSFLWELQLK